MLYYANYSKKRHSSVLQQWRKISKAKSRNMQLDTTQTTKPTVDDLL